MSDVFIVGCGYLGLPCARLWLDQGRKVYALTRTKAKEFQNLGITPVVGDITIPDSLHALPQVNTLLFAVGLDRSAGRSMHEVYVEGLKNTLAIVGKTPKVIYVSSSSVYAQTHGGWVTETDETTPTEASGKTVLEAEQTLFQLAPHAMALRFAGIYGKNRLLREKAILAGEPLVGDAEKWLNLIHVEDGARAALCAESKYLPGEILNITDGNPCTRREYYSELARILNAPPARFEPGPNVRGDSHRRVSNSKAKAQIQFQPVYVNFKEGLLQAVAS